MKTTDKIINITFQHLYKKGYAGAGLSDILDEVGITKGALYYHFKNKNKLFFKTVEQYVDEFIETIWETPLRDSKDPIKTIIKQIDTYRDLFINKEHYLTIEHGSLFGNFITDMSDTNEDISKYLNEALNRWCKELENALTNAQTLKLTKTDFNAKDEALFIISSIEGSIVIAKGFNSIDTLNTGFSTLNKYIKGL